ncbi:MAG: hypothetical protein Q9164_004856 [Protoblastenia rupestris]
MACRTVVEAHLSRIEAYNPIINALVALNTEALSVADELDATLSTQDAKGPLFCVPILLKDNFDTHGLPTTGGCQALADSQPAADAPVVKALKNAGAIVLGKTNMHEMALEGLTISSLGGHTLNPYDLTRTPGGSSGGTGAAIAASLAVFGTGTDTMNSLRSPASANSLFSIRPTRELVSRTRTIPVSYTQDAVGPVARTVEDLAVALTVMASVGYDSDGNATAAVPDFARQLDYSAGLHGGSLQGKRFGLIKGFFNRTASDETTPVNKAMETMIETLLAAGAKVLPITSSGYNTPNILATCDTQRFEYRSQLDAYLSDPSLKGPHPSSFNELYNSTSFLVIPHQYPFIHSASISSTQNTSYAQTIRNISHLTSITEATFLDNRLDALIYPEQSNLAVKIGSPSQYGRNGILAAVTGFPVVTVPVGFSPPTVHAPRGVPIGMEILGLKWTEAKLLNIAKLIAEARPVRRMPKFTEMEVERKAYDKVPSMMPNSGNTPDAYHIGVLA